MLKFNDTTLFLDIETHSVDERWSMSPQEYFRLGQWAWGEGPVHTTSSYEEFMPLLDRATTIVAHNGHSFDWSVLYGKGSLKPVHLAREGKLFDTFIHATLAHPAPFGGYTNSAGVFVKCVKPEQFRKWYRLENLGHQLGVDGKLFELSDLADQYEYDFVDQYSPKTGKLLKAKKKIRKDVCCGYGHIPVDHPDFVAYAEQDVVALRNVARALLEKMPFNAYAKRAQLIMALMAQVTRNGFRVDQEKMNERIRSQAEEAAWILDDLNGKYGLPLHKTLPLRTNEGKEALAKAFAELGIGPDAFERTANGSVSWSGDSVKKAAGYKETDHGWKAPEITSERQEQVVKLADAVATLAGQRSLAELTRDSLYEDGVVHPDIMPLQRSGRMSTTKPGLTIWDDSHKDYYLPDSDDELNVEFDFSNADARAVAAESGDKKFAERFQPGQDGHMINAWLLWGKEKVGTDKKNPETAKYRQDAKAPGHGIGYNMGASKMAATTGLPLEDTKRFVRNYQKEYQGVVAWQQRVVKAAQRLGFVMNSWGRRMPVESGREFTQTPALLGQGDTNELLMDGLMRLPERLLRKVKLTVHDAIVMSLPKATIKEDIETIVRCFSVIWRPREGGQAIEFPMTLHAEPGVNWQEACKEH
jgi:DNA polymerase-1